MRNEVKDYFGQEAQRQLDFILAQIIFTFRKIKLLYKQIQEYPNKKVTHKKHLPQIFFIFFP